MRNIIASLDIGSCYIKLVVAEIFKSKLNILLATNVNSQGIKNGFIVNRESFNEAIVDLFNKAEEQIGLKIKKVIVNVPILNAKYELVEGKTSITNEEFVVTSSDIVHAMQSSVYNKIPENMELVNLIPIVFRINNDVITSSPLGMGAEKLSCKCVLVTAPKKGIAPIIDVLDKNDIEVIDLAFSSFGDYELLHTKADDDVVGAVVNIGAETTSVSIFNKGVITNGEVIPIGSSNIDNDLSYMYKLNPLVARSIKEDLSLSHINFAQVNESLEVVNIDDEKIKVNQYEVTEIVTERIKEIFNLIKKQINLLTKKEISYIIVTGGLTEAADLDILLREYFGNVARIGNVLQIGARNNMYSTSVGLIKFYNRKLKLRGKEFSIFTKEELDEFGGIGKKGSSDNSILSKIFGIFFDN